MHRWKYDEPNMSDGSLLVKVEDLIYMALGPDDMNVVDFQIIQLILLILARQLRMLEQLVEVRSKESLKHSREPSGPVGSKRDVKVEKGKVERKLGSPRGRTGDKKIDHDAEMVKDASEVYKIDANRVDKDAHPGQKPRGLVPLKRAKETKPGKHEAPKKGMRRPVNEQEEAAPHESRQKSSTSTTIEEIERGKSKVLVVDKGPTSIGRPRVGSVEVVTKSQFDLLESEVKRLAETAGLSTDLTFPDNEQLRSDLLEGNVTLPEAMEAMQVNARVQAAEKAIGRMAELLTQLASAGGIPEELAQRLKTVQLDLYPVHAEEIELTQKLPELPSIQDGDRRDTPNMVTRPELDETLQTLKADMARNIQHLTEKSSLAVEAAARTAQFVSERLAIALLLDGRMNDMQSLVSDYGVQLKGFDAGLTTQMQGFQEQMSQIRTDLKCGLEQLASARNNTEATAIKDLTERYGDLVQELENVHNTHQAIFTFQSNLTDELKSLVESVEMLRDQKVDRDEVLDALRDKADTSRLSGLLKEQKFEEARADLEQLLEGCQQKFRKQDKAWMCAVDDLMAAAETKVGQLELVSERDAIQDQLRSLHEYLQRLEDQLGDPKAALLMRQLSRDAVCGSCGATALMEPGEDPKPPALPPLPSHSVHPSPSDPVPQPCTVQQPCKTIVTQAVDDDAIGLHRWCGGAHTLQQAGRQRAPRFIPSDHPTRRYDGVGTDGKMYLLEEDLQPCKECNPPPCTGAGDSIL